MTTLRLATWNILHGLDAGDAAMDFDGVVAALQRLDADIVALQEVDRFQHRSGGVDQTAALAQALGYRGFFVPSLFGSPEDRWTATRGRDLGGPAYGIGLLSRHVIIQWRSVVLPGGGDGVRRRPVNPLRPWWDREPRVAAQVRLNVGGRALTVTATHLSFFPWRGVRQLRRVVRAAGRDSPQVLMGDLNLTAPVVRSVARGWQHAGGAPTHPAWKPALQLDHILIRGGQPIGVEVAPPGPSDHLALVADVRFDP